MIPILRIITLAIADAINPCALAIMTMVLISILLANPDKKHKVITSGLSFILAVFIGYMFYGFVIVQFFKSFAIWTSNIYPYVTKGLAIGAILLGLMNLKDFFYYKPGSIGTEMPLKMSPRLKILINKITSAKGAFILGLFVTLFLLPCTIGPYIIASQALIGLSWLIIILYLILYNLIFILPMLIITFIVYEGLYQVEKISNWKDKNIKYIHLLTGILLIGLGVLIFFGIL